MDNNQQKPKGKKSDIGIILLVVFLCILPIIAIVGVMLLSLGVLVFNQNQDTASNAITSISELQISSFNARYESYIGDGKTMSSVIALVQSTKVNNLHEDNKIDINLTLIDGSTYSIEDINSSVLSTSRRYNISAKYGNDGYINSIDIIEQ